LNNVYYFGRSPSPAKVEGKLGQTPDALQTHLDYSTPIPLRPSFQAKLQISRAVILTGHLCFPHPKSERGRVVISNVISNWSRKMSQMKAVRIHAYGGTDVLINEDAPRPKAGDGEVLIRVMATTVNPYDCAVRAGYMSAYFKPTFPLILGTDASGLIEEVGPGVTAFKRGDRVYARGGVTRDGAYAEYAVVPASDAAAAPRSLDHVHAAALPHVTLTAWQALIELANLTNGQTVLIHGATGGVGHVAVQIAKWRGARVIGTASDDLDFLRELKIDQAIDYSTTPFEDVVGQVDVVLDTVGGETQDRSWKVLKPGGILVSTIQAPSQETATAHGVRQAMVFSSPPIGKVLTEVAALVDSGQIKPRICTVLPLAEVAKAHQMVEGRHTRGKIVLQVAA
jgi:NADPH:quinone reductase-like Zn-dependent oxidoreductase